jgi:hypothetical protein
VRETVKPPKCNEIEHNAAGRSLHQALNFLKCGICEASHSHFSDQICWQRQNEIALECGVDLLIKLKHQLQLGSLGNVINAN